MIINKTNKKIIGRKCSYCDNYFSKASGLMFKKKAETLIFDFKKEKKISLHMMFVFFPIDVVFLDDKQIVVELKENFKPFAFYNSREKARYAIELPAGTVKKTVTKVGDEIRF